MKTIFIILIGVAVAACSKSLTYNEAIQRNLTSEDLAEKEGDAQFLVEAKSLSLLEEELGKLASTQGYAAGIQSFGQKITEDHQKMNEQIKDLASNHKISVPEEMSADHRMKYEEVRMASREDFDKEFINAIEEIYKDNIELYESFATVAQVDEIRMFAAENLGLLRANEEMADDLEDDLL